MDQSFGLFLNMGSNLGKTAQDVFQLTLTQTDRAEAAGFHDLWVTEHHFIPFGVNPSALTASGFLLGRTERVRVGTAVTLCPLHHPLELAERAALLDQLSGGRFDLGLGRGGYLRDYQLLEVDPARWDEEPTRSAEAILHAWEGKELHPAEGEYPGVSLQPAPLTRPSPPLFLASSSPEAVQFAAERSLPLQHYFASPVEARVGLERAYAEANPDASVGHVHTLILVIGDDEAALRERLHAALEESFQGGHWPHVPQAPNRHVDADGQPIGPDRMARFAARNAVVGPVESVRDQLAAFVEATGATRLVFYMEAIANAELTLQSIERFANEWL